MSLQHPFWKIANTAPPPGQAHHRIWSQVFSYLTPDSIEQRIGQVMAKKCALFDDLIDRVPLAGLRRLDLPTLLRAVDA